MQSMFRQRREPTKVYVELVATSYRMLIPALLMSSIFLGVGSYCATLIGGRATLLVLVGGMTASIVRLGLILAYRRQSAPRLAKREITAAWEVGLAVTTVLFALSVGLLGALSLASALPTTEILSTGTLFGFCAGAVARGYVRPWVCSTSVVVAATPIVLAALIHGGPSHWALAGMIVAFLLGSLETIRHNYQLVRQQIRLREEISMVARQDALTELANRFGLREAFRTLTRATAHPQMIAVHCFDLDRFKPVNDRYGHPAGDELLRRLADRMRAAVRPEDLVARLGGDEFVVVQAGISHAGEADMFARRLVRAINAPYDIGGETIEIGVSLGYATSPPHRASLDELLLAADVALYRVKDAGGGVGSSMAGDRDIERGLLTA